MTPEVEGLVQSGAPATKPANQGSYWEFVAIPIRNYRLVLLCGVLWCGFQVGRAYLGVPTYTSSATFRPLGGDNVARVNRELIRLATMAGVVEQSSQNFGIAFYRYLMTSPRILDDIISKTYELSDGSWATLPDLLNVSETIGNQERRLRATRARVRQSIVTERLNQPNVLRFDVTTRWPEVSYAIAQGLLESLNSFRADVSREVAQEEQDFISGQMERIKAEVVAWEDSLQAFLAANRVIMDHSELAFTRSRIRGELEQRRSLQSELQRAYLAASINAVRESPSLLVTSYPRLPRLSQRADFSPITLLPPLVVGLFAGTVLAVGREWVRRIWDYDNPAVAAVREAWPKLTSASFLRKWFWPQAAHGSKGDPIP